MTITRLGTTCILFLLLQVPMAHAQSDDVYWHTDPGVKTCSMVIDPSLTQAQWSRFVRQAGAIVSFRPLGPAEPLGKMHFKVVIEESRTPVDQHDLAWINTFTHPDYKYCPLGDAVLIPKIRAEFGVSDDVDIGGYWTTSPGANYGLVGGELKYAFLHHSRRLPAVSVRTSVSMLTGVPDFNMGVYSVDLMASRHVAWLVPYLGIRESLSVGTETTSKVKLDREDVAITQGYVGAVCSVWKVDLTAEYDASFVNTLAVGAGFNF